MEAGRLLIRRDLEPVDLRARGPDLVGGELVRLGRPVPERPAVIGAGDVLLRLIVERDPIGAAGLLALHCARRTLVFLDQLLLVLLDLGRGFRINRRRHHDAELIGLAEDLHSLRIPLATEPIAALERLVPDVIRQEGLVAELGHGEQLLGFQRRGHLASVLDLEAGDPRRPAS